MRKKIDVMYTYKDIEYYDEVIDDSIATKCACFRRISVIINAVQVNLLDEMEDSHSH